MASESDPLASMNSDLDSELGLNFLGRFRFSKIYNVEDKLDHLYQNSLHLKAYYTRLTTLWDEMTKVEDSPSCTCGRCTCNCTDRWLQLYERRNTVRFLMRLNDSYSQVRKQITMMDPFPNFKTIYNLLSHAEQQQQQHYSFAFSEPRAVLPPGYTFAPTDEDIMLHYLKPYLQGNRSSFGVPIHRVDVYKWNPNQLSEEFVKGNNMEWFFISERILMGKGGKNMNLSVNGGYWRKTVVSPEHIKAGQGVVGYKSSLVYYVGEEPNGIKEDWVMNEYWLESSDDDNNERANLALCKIYQKKYEDDLVEFVEASLEEVDEQPHQPQFSGQLGQFNPPHEAALEEDENPGSLSQLIPDKSFDFNQPDERHPFKPTDEVLVTCYLKPYLEGKKDSTITLPIHRVDIYKSNPDKLSEEFKRGNDKEWFFISERYKVKEGGKRMKRGDDRGYWKVKKSAMTINAGEGLVGYKYVLDYYVGKLKGDWSMEEYWLESSDDINNEMGNHALYKLYLNLETAKKKKEEADFIEFLEAGLEEVAAHDRVDGGDN